MPSALIQDGFTLDGVILARKGIHPEVRFKYRPAFPADAYEYHEADRSTGKKRLAATLKVLLKYLVEWNVAEDKKGQDLPAPVPINEATLSRVHFVVLEKLLNIVLGYSASEELEDDIKNSETA